MIATWHWCLFWCRFLVCSRLKTGAIHLQIERCWIPPMENKNIHFIFRVFYKCQNRVSVRTAAKINQVYFKWIPVKKLFGRFRQGDFSVNGQLLSGRYFDVEEDTLHAIAEKPRRFWRIRLTRVWKLIS